MTFFDDLLAFSVLDILRLWTASLIYHSDFVGVPRWLGWAARISALANITWVYFNVTSKFRF